MFGKIGSFVGNAISKVGHLGGQALSKIGVIKHAYNSVNNSVGGLIGRAQESIPMAGPVLGSIGKFLDNKESMRVLANTLKRADVYGEGVKKVGEALERLKKS